MSLFSVQRAVDYGPIGGIWEDMGSSGRKNSPWLDTLIIPLYGTLASAILLLIHLLVKSLFRKSDAESRKHVGNGMEPDESISRSERVFKLLEIHAQRYGGAAIFWYMFARMIGCFLLLGISVHNLFLSYRQGGEVRGHILDILLHKSLFIVYLYTSVLSSISIVSHKLSKITTRHTIFLLFISLGVYVYRDVWPLATTTETPVDIAEGKLLWVKITLLAITALLIPLVIPRQYIPVDPNDPMPIPNAELTASFLSFLLYSFLDPVIFSASKVRHLSWSQLPPLTDSNRAKYLKQTAFPHIDTFHGAKKRHLFFGLMWFYRWEYTVMALTIIAQVLFNFAPPIAINQILVYLETNGADAKIRPWFWIVLLFMGPIVTSMSNQWYLFIAGQVIVLTEGLLSQLVFEHSLRIRMKAETPKAVAPVGGDEAVVATPEIASVDGQGSSNSSNATTSGGSSPSSTVKGKEKAKVEPAKKAAEVKKSGGQDNLIGKINNLITTDVSNILDSKDFLVLFLEIPVQTILCVVFLYKVLGWSAFIGFSVILIFIPIPGLVAKKIQSVQVKRMQKTDERVQAVTEVVNTLRMVKLFGWEQAMDRRIGVKRKEELHWVWIQKVLEMSNGLINFILTSLTMLVTYGTYTLIMKQQLNASIIFSSMAVFNLFSSQLHSVFYFTTNVIQGKVSLDRMNDFLRNTELLDTFSGKPQDQLILPSLTEDDREIGFRDAVFSWSTDSEADSLSPSLRSFKLRVNGELLFKRECINLILGPTGCGKTSMLMALLGEMHFVSSSAEAWFNLPRSGGVAYAAQESWVQNATIRENILFGSQLDEQRYKEVIRQCALEKDLELFEAGDQTEVGERGLTLSGGQKARVTLARAIYSPAEIILLDDVLAALDVHTSKQIVEDCFKGDLIKGRTIIMVTHNIALTSPIADFVVSIGLDGTVTSQSSDISIALDSDPSLAQELAEEEAKLQKTEEEVVLPKKEANVDGKLIIAEEIVEGHVSWKSVKLFLSSLSGGHPIIFFTLWIAGLVFESATSTFQLWFLGFWGSQYEQHAPSEVRVGFYLGAYSGTMGIVTVIYGMTYLYYALGSLRASKVIHENLVGSILSSTLRWLDETPTSRIIARCTQDIRAVEGPIARWFSVLADLGISSLVKLSVIVLYSPVFVFPGLGVAMIGIYIGNIYLKAQMSVKREMSNAKAPVLAHLGASIAGLTSIRAYSAEDRFKTESLRRIDHYTRIARTSYNLNRWIAIRIDSLGAIFTGSLAWYLVYRRSVSSANTGLSLNLAVDFCSVLLFIVRIYNDFEVQSNSLERIKSYIDIEHEPKPTEEGKPPAAWPTSGELRVERLSARYSQTGPKVLHDISFNIRSGERVGVVGRTGSGKSSLTLALLRCILTEGNVFYDGIPTNNLNLDALRSNITIIPQMPELLSGTLRRNLDPFEQHDDATLNAALRDAGLFSLQTESGEGRITLDTSIASSGSNLSVGQRQIIALARAIVRKSKVLILDEATSAIDYQTDAIIQKTLRHELGTDVTILTVAHRLQTIMDADKIMVLENGCIIEFDSPKVLLTREDSKLKALVDESADKAALYEMAQNA